MGHFWGPWGMGLALALAAPLPAAFALPGPNPATAPASPETTSRERELLERIRELKTPRLRSYGACRYDWGAWRLNDRGVRSTASECGEPPVRGTVAVYCDTLQINRRVEEGPWEGWRLPYSADESPLLGGEDRLVASLCAKVRLAGRGEAAPAMGAPAKPLPPPKPVPPAKPLPPAKPSTTPAKPVPVAP